MTSVVMRSLEALAYMAQGANTVRDRRALDQALRDTATEVDRCAGTGADQDPEED